MAAEREAVVDALLLRKMTSKLPSDPHRTSAGAATRGPNRTTVAELRRVIDVTDNKRTIRRIRMGALS